MRKIDLRIAPPLALVAMLGLLAVPADGATFHVFGKVYGADPLPEGVTLPAELLPAGIGADQLVGADGVAPTAPVAFSRVNLVADATGEVLADDLARTGAYFATFTSPASEVAVRLAVYDASSGSLLGEVGPVTLSEGSNQLYPLVAASPRTSGVPHPVANGFYAFTRVGLIEVMDIEQSAASANQGLAAFPGAAARWQNAPFAGTLNLFGAVGRNFYPLAGVGTYCYQVQVTPDGGTPFLIGDTLNKGRYVVKEVAGKVTVSSSMKEVGPVQRPWGECYDFTPLSEIDPGGGQVFWSFPDLLARWSTGNRVGKHTLEVIVRNRTTGAVQPVSGPELTLHLDNRPVALSFDAVAEQTLSTATPPTVTSSNDLLANACDIVSLLGSEKRLYIELTAQQPGGFLASYSLTGRSNDPTHPVMSWAADSYPGTGSFVGVSHHGESRTGSQFPGTCAYAFHLNAWGRATTGYSRPFHPREEKVYYVQVP